MTRRYPVLPEHIADALRQLTPSVDRGMRYYPCSVRLKSGEFVPCVYITEAKRWFQIWGVWPEDDRGKTALNVNDISEVYESEFRLPARFADRLYVEGESGMGYTVFTVEFTDGSRQAYITGNAVDFITYPAGKSAKDVLEVYPHIGREDSPVDGPDYTWALYEPN